MIQPTDDIIRHLIEHGTRVGDLDPPLAAGDRVANLYLDRILGSVSAPREWEDDRIVTSRATEPHDSTGLAPIRVGCTVYDTEDHDRSDPYVVIHIEPDDAVGHLVTLSTLSKAADVAEPRHLLVVGYPDDEPPADQSPTGEQPQPAHHDLRLHTRWYDVVADGTKTAEVRYDDRGYAAGAKITFHEVGTSGSETGRTCDATITHALRHDDFRAGIAEGYAVLSIAVDRRDDTTTVTVDEMADHAASETATGQVAYGRARPAGWDDTDEPMHGLRAGDRVRLRAGYDRTNCRAADVTGPPALAGVIYFVTYNGLDDDGEVTLSEDGGRAWAIPEAQELVPDDATVTHADPRPHTRPAPTATEIVDHAHEIAAEAVEHAQTGEADGDSVKALVKALVEIATLTSLDPAEPEPHPWDRLVQIADHLRVNNRRKGFVEIDTDLSSGEDVISVHFGAGADFLGIGPTLTDAVDEMVAEVKAEAVRASRQAMGAAERSDRFRRAAGFDDDGGAT